MNQTDLDSSNNLEQDKEAREIKNMYMLLGIFFGSLCLLVAIFLYFSPVIAKKIPFSAEKQFIKPYEYLISKYFPHETNEVVEAYLHGLSEGISAAMGLSSEIEIDMHYLDSDEVNAFTTLGGHVFVTKGLIETVKTENALAMVVAHELAHQKNRDPISSLGRGVALQLIFSSLFNDYGTVDLGWLSDAGLMYFSREQEQAADIEALFALNSYYGHVAGYDEFFNAIYDPELESGSKIENVLSSHPETGERIEVLRDKIEEFGFIQKQTVLIPDHIIEEIKGAN